uniref:LRAT domain-containing protein n=1 Tax=Araucaria cunninghamii TaxID=56994 RepID=A0A0D6R3T4_ARACU
MGLLSNRISRDDLKPGEHIYSWRSAYSYAHHGIYVGDNKVIHFIQGRGNEVTTGNAIDLLLLSSGPSQNDKVCQTCNYQRNNNGVISSCLDCFLAGGNLYRFEYGVKTSLFVAKARGGTCTLAESDSPETVIHRAKYLLENGFGCYNIFKNNCEDFSIYCKTGLLVTDGSGIGPSGQTASVVGAFTAVFSSPLRFLITNTPTLSVIAGGLYCLSRYAADIGIRRDVTRVPVENLAVRVGQNDSQDIASMGRGPLIQL